MIYYIMFLFISGTFAKELKIQDVFIEGEYTLEDSTICSAGRLEYIKKYSHLKLGEHVYFDKINKGIIKNEESAFSNCKSNSITIFKNTTLIFKNNINCTNSNNNRVFIDKLIKTYNRLVFSSSEIVKDKVIKTETCIFTKI